MTSVGTSGVYGESFFFCMQTTTYILAVYRYIHVENDDDDVFNLVLFYARVDSML